jgi:hypothetical protein
MILVVYQLNYMSDLLKCYLCCHCQGVGLQIIIEYILGSQSTKGEEACAFVLDRKLATRRCVYLHF